MSETTHPLVVLAEKLLAATRRGKIDWQSETDTSFSYMGSGTSVFVRSEETDGQPPIEVMLVNREGVVVESVSSHRPPDAWSQREERPWHDTLVDLYSAARSSAFDIQKEISNVLDSIEGDDEPPF